MKSAKNIIDKIFLDFTYKATGNSRHDAIDKTESFFYNNLLPKIDLLLSKYGDQSNVRIDTLTIDLDKISLANLPEKLLSELEAVLEKHQPNPQWTRLETENKDQQKFEALDVLIQFLQTGTLPWHQGRDILPAKLLNTILKQNEAVAVDRLRQLFTTNAIALNRFILQFTAQQTYEIFESFASENAFKSLLIAWQQFISKSAKPEQIQLAFHFVLQQQAVKNEIEFLNYFVETLVLPRLNADRSALPKIVSQLEAEYQKAKTPEEIAALFRTFEKNHTTTKRKGDTGNKIVKTGNTIKSEETPAKRLSDTNNEANINSFAVDNAGLVILFPYLQMFFSRLGLLEEEQFINTAAQLKAAQVLQYLATYSLKTPEYLLALNKALCGIDMAMPCPGTLRLTKTQKQTCDVLLDAVINNWPPMRGTSIVGFQQSFLQRNGTLKKDEDNWTLHVERKAFDILFEQLPWGFSVIKFPWNENFIHVQW